MQRARSPRSRENGHSRLAATREVIGRYIARRSRTSLRSAVEGAWLALGGPACVESETDLEDAEIFLDHLEKNEAAGCLPDLPTFELSLSRLFALPDLAASDRLQVMTIHKAKGLEFDTVIVPGLGGGTARDDRKLFMWMETPSSRLLLAPINATGAKGDDIYEFIRGLDKEKADHESARLLYVAATRRSGACTCSATQASTTHGAPRRPRERSSQAVAGDGGQFAAPRARACRRGPRCRARQAGELRRLDAGSCVSSPAAASMGRAAERATWKRSSSRGWRYRAARGKRRAPLAAAHRGGRGEGLDEEAHRARTRGDAPRARRRGVVERDLDVPAIES
jgi:ATP-dependent exoDNAse (exonuclease V) beta subunit